MRKRIFALLCCGCLLAGLLTGCKKETTDKESIYEKYTPAGTVYLHFGPALSVLFDDTGMILRISGDNNTGRRVATCCKDQEFKSLTEGVPALVQYAIDNKLLDDAKTMVIRVGEGESPSSETLLEDLAKLSQTKFDGKGLSVKTFFVMPDALTTDGYLPSGVAAQVAAVYLECEVANVTCSPLTEGVYTVTYGEKSCTVDGFTGGVTMK